MVVKSDHGYFYTLRNQRFGAKMYYYNKKIES
jgi:hypothetical protein